MQRIHLKAPKNWINDPNGFIYFGGRYHMFYQYFPYAPVWGRMHWGHAVSSDLVTWEHKDIALYPSKAEDRSGCFSGSAVEYEGRMYIFYTGVSYTDEDPENINIYRNEGFVASQMMITSDGTVFDNIKAKRMIIPPLSDPAIGSAVHTRDPKVWRGKNAWYMVLGSTFEKKQGRLLIYRSYDLENWEYMNYSEKDGLGWMWECPDYFETDGQGVAVFSPIGFLCDGPAYDAAAVCTFADFDEDTCIMNLHDGYTLLDYGIDLYAPQSTTDREGRRVIEAWARMPEPVDGEWSGIFCIPRVVRIKDGQLCFAPHPDVAAAFSREISHASQACEEGYLVRVSLAEGEHINIGGYVISREDGHITADRSTVFAGHSEIRCRFEAPADEGECSLEIFVDSHLIEVYINGKDVITNVVYGITDEISGHDFRIFTLEYIHT